MKRKKNTFQFPSFERILILFKEESKSVDSTILSNMEGNFSKRKRSFTKTLKKIILNNKLKKK